MFKRPEIVRRCVDLAQQNFEVTARDQCGIAKLYGLPGDRI
jgi:hypothetical protein